MQITQASLANGRNPISILNLTDDQRVAYDDIIKFINSDFNPNDYRRALVGPAGSGKALVNGTKVLTDKGWQNIETIKIGDKVATPYNGFVTVNGVYPQDYKEYLYKITFSDGREIICDEHHLWLVRTKRQLYYYRIIKGKNTRYSKIIETSQLYKERNELFDNKLGCKYRIPNCAIENNHKYLPIPPYSLGVIIGDGCLTDNYAELSEHLHISNNEQDIITKVANELNCNYKWHKEYNYTNNLFGDNILLINKYLDDFNLRVKSVDKFIPRIYLESSIEQRKELLKGLMDTDGSVVGGRYTFTTSSEKLLDDVVELCRSLGYIVGKLFTDRRGNNFSYTIHIQTNDIIVSSQKHLSKVKTDKNKYYDSIGIKSIEKIKGNRQTTCISVDDKDKLYVAENYIVTHNTYLVNALITNCNLSYSTIGLSAPTHKACRVLGESIKNSSCKVITLQSALGLRLNFDVEKFDINNPPFDPKGKIKIQDLKLFIVDEASMINKGLKTFLEKICSNKQCKVLYIGK